MKKLFSIALLFCAMAAYAQNPAEQAALDIANSELAEPVKPKPSEFWTLNFTGNLNYGGTFLNSSESVDMLSVSSGCRALISHSCSTWAKPPNCSR